MGAIAVAAALGNNVLAWRFMQSDHPLSRHEAWLFFPGIALVLLLWLFSRVLSNGSSRLGFLALVVLSIGPLVPGFIHRLLMLQNP
ncbi:MAG: hypothetical protein K9N23_14040 [Akkermansiaceae bacterium]|nr:hypothetical protein [Akkermansiaceae bacterium]MCF7732805.1 hypothetical protein [Akkermansiaceae bacterium]